jgi:hypothetical protein
MVTIIPQLLQHGPYWGLGSVSEDHRLHSPSVLAVVTAPSSDLLQLCQITWIFDHRNLAEAQKSRKVACAKNPIS